MKKESTFHTPKAAHPEQARTGAVRPLRQGADKTAGEVPEAEELTDEERADLERHRALFKKIAKTWITFGEALRDIRDRRLYRGQFATFEDFCRAEIQMGKSNAHRLLQCSEIATLVSTNVDIPLREAHVRPLLRLQDPAKQVHAFEQAVGQAKEKKKPFTAVFVTRAVNEMLDAEKPGDIEPKPVTKGDVIAGLSRDTTRGLEKLPIERIVEFAKAVAEFRAAWLNAHGPKDSASAVTEGGIAA